jgi:hypothetical protein
MEHVLNNEDIIAYDENLKLSLSTMHKILKFCSWWMLVFMVPNYPK